MGIYRFMESQHIGQLLKGELRFTALSYYRLLEKVYQDHWIGDCHEGHTITRIDTELISGQDDCGMRQKLADLKILSGDSTSVKMSGVQYIDRVDGFILSFAVGELEDLSKRMSRGSYDACAVFNDIHLIAKIVYETGLTSDGCAVSDVFFPPEVGPVTYDGNEVDLSSSDGHLPASPLLKRKMYKDQQEWRIYFRPRVLMDLDVVTVSADFPDGCIQQQFRDAVTPPGDPWPDLGIIEKPLEVLQKIGHSIFLERMISDSDEVAKYFADVHYRSALLAYWQLRKEHRWSTMDFYFSMDDFAVVVSGLMAKLDHYEVRVTGVDRFDIGRGDYEGA